MYKMRFKKLSFLIVFFILLVLGFNLLKAQKIEHNSELGVTVENGVQIISIKAKSGFSPNNITAQSNTPTILRITTENTYDCSAYVSIPILSYSKFLPSTGSSDIEINPQSKGAEILGSCSMGMYGFKVTFV